MVSRKIQVLNQLVDALDDIKNHGFKVLSISYAPDGNLIVIVKNTLNQIE